MKIKSASKTISLVGTTLLLLLLLVGCGETVVIPPPPAPTPTVSTIQIPTFSAEGGFYAAPFTLNLSSESADATIYFTTDGSDPRTSTTAAEYTTGISIYDNTNDPNIYSALTDIMLGDYFPPQYNIPKGITVRAVLKNPAEGFGDVVTNSYFVGKNAAYYSDFKVISMVTDSGYLFHRDTGAYMIGSKYYEWLKSDDFVQYDSGDIKNITNYNTKGRESEFPVNIQVFENGKPAYSANVGARIAGNWSRSHAQKSFRFYARKEYGDGNMDYAFFDKLTDINGEAIVSFDKVTLRNGGNDYQELHFRDALIHNLTTGLAFDVMASEPCILFINGEFWGFYMIRERTDGNYIESHYGIPKEDVVIIKNSNIEEGTETDLEDFHNFCIWAATADMTQDTNYQQFCASMDVQSLMDYITVETYINNADWAKGYDNNWQVWRSRTVNPSLPKSDGKWRFILYDTEYSTGIYGQLETQYDYDLLNYMDAGDTDFNLPNIVRNLCRNPEFAQAFHDNYLRIIETCFDPDLVCETITTYANTYGFAIKDTLNRFGLDWAANNYDGEIDELKAFFRLRPEFAKQYLDNFH